MGHYLSEVVGVDRVEHVEEVITRRSLACWVRVREELHHLRVLRELGIQGLHAELFVLRHLDLLDLLLLEQLLLAC